MQQQFHGFWMGGFEGADHRNGSGTGLDANLANGHAGDPGRDYAALVAMDIHVVRESVGWRLLDEAGAAGLARLRSQASTAAAHGMQVIWTLMHYGWPARLDPLAREAEFITAFAAHCAQVCRIVRDVDGPAPAFQPINEISFLAWAATSTGLIPRRPA
ncbi:MAG: glycosyl transferase group 1 [Rhodoferax sp.]|nr:glycosyl transferase group 1 [Rhodoferax sp.]